MTSETGAERNLMDFKLSENIRKKTLVVVKQEGKSEEILSLATAAQLFNLDLYDMEALRRGHTLHYSHVTISRYN